MKRTLSIIGVTAAVAVIMMACNNGTGTKIDANELAQFQVWKAEQANAVVKKTTAKRTTSYQSPKMVSETAYPAKAPAKKGWSKAAKGAVIGAGSGAILGAVINKRNRAIGAVIGGVVGGGVGYGVGRTMDKKDGRINFGS